MKGRERKEKKSSEKVTEGVFISLSTTLKLSEWLRLVRFEGKIMKSDLGGWDQAAC